MRVAMIAVMMGMVLGGCQYIEYPSHGPDAGNPNHFAYADEPGSIYDRAANPPSDIGRASYDAYGPLPRNLPADATLPPPGMPAGPVTMTPVPPGNPALRNPANPAMGLPANR